MNKVKKTKGTPDPVDVHVGQRLRLKRSLVGMSQEKLAKAIGITFQQIQKYEKGTNRISAGRLFQLSKTLNVPITYFYEQLTHAGQTIPSNTFGFADNKQEHFTTQTKDIMQQKETLELVRAYYEIKDPDTRKKLMGLIRSMTDNR